MMLECLQSLKMVFGMYIATPVMQKFHSSEVFVGISACYFIAKQPENTFKTCNKVELQHSSKENEEGTSLPHETLDIAQLPNPYSVQGHTDPKSQYNHQAG